MGGGERVFTAAETAGMMSGGMASLNSPGGAAGGRSGNVNVTVNALTADPRLIIEEIKRWQRRGGVL